MNHKIGLVVPVYNRHSYVKRCFDSLRKLTVKPNFFVLVDDGSNNTEIDSLCISFNLDLKSVAHIKWDKNKGVKEALKFGIEYAFKQGAELVINLDSDAIVSPDFVERLVKLHRKENRKLGNTIYSSVIVSGFNNPKEKEIFSEEGYCMKSHANGINMCFDRQQYEDCIRPALLSKGNWDFETKSEFAITIPSCVQHVGVKSSMGHAGADRAKDFKLLSLPNVTLFGIDSHDVAGIERAASISQEMIDFGAVNIITDDLFTKGGSNEQRRRDYSRFMLKELANHFNTSHVLTIHADGYVVNPEAWSDEFLQYDYAGASWAYKDGMNVGNGGFSLRSKKLCDILATQELQPNLMHPEDECICRIYRPSLEKEFGIKFAPEEVANRFSIEAYGSQVFPGGNRYSGQFGFHSVHVDFRDSDVPEEWRYNPRKVQSNNKPTLHKVHHKKTR